VNAAAFRRAHQIEPAQRVVDLPQMKPRAAVILRQRNIAQRDCQRHVGNRRRAAAAGREPRAPSRFSVATAIAESGPASSRHA